MKATTENVTLAVLAGTGSVIRDAYTGNRSADSSCSNTGSGICGGEGLTMVFDRVTGNI